MIRALLLTTALVGVILGLLGMSAWLAVAAALLVTGGFLGGFVAGASAAAKTIGRELAEAALDPENRIDAAIEELAEATVDSLAARRGGAS